MRWNLSSRYLNLSEIFYTRQQALPVTKPKLGVFNANLAHALGLGEWNADDLEVLAGNRVPPGITPFAQAYAGHQYGHFTMLGDGRALILGEQESPKGELYDLQLKGSGPTPYSRSGDGRAALGPMLREYLMGEAMHALGIPTTRGLAVVETGQAVLRDGELPGAVLSRVASSHLRVGTFEFADATQQPQVLQELTDYAIARHYPEAATQQNPPAAFLEAVLEGQAKLVAQWMSVGFVHGVMNTDNVSISGETLDYGPCAFLDTYRADQVFSSIDRRGRYAYANQPGIARWNLIRLAESLIPVLHTDQEAALTLARGLIESFADRYEGHYLSLMAAKLGILPEQATRQLVDGLLGWMEETGADYTVTFRVMTEGKTPLGLETWCQDWRSRLPDFEMMAASNPRVIPRNHRVEEALAAAVTGNYAPFHNLLAVLKTPFELKSGQEAYADPPKPEDLAVPYRTFCGT